MTELILKILASVVSWLAATGIDRIVGKYLAVATIAFEKGASEEAVKGFRTRMAWLSANMATKHKDWAAWRDRVK